MKQTATQQQGKRYSRLPQLPMELSDLPAQTHRLLLPATAAYLSKFSTQRRHLPECSSSKAVLISAGRGRAGQGRRAGSMAAGSGSGAAASSVCPFSLAQAGRDVR